MFKWMDKEDVVYIYTMEYYLTIKMNEIMPFSATCMDLEIIILSEMSDKDKYFISLICEDLKRCKWTYLQNKNKLSDLESKLMVVIAERGEKDKLGVWD